MSQHIGIVACSAEGAALCYRTICVEGAALVARYLVESEVYPERLRRKGLDYARPAAADRDESNRIIFDELVNGVFTPEAVASFQQTIERLKADGCDAVVLGCTEIPLIINDTNSPLPTLDSTRLLARAALERAIA